MLRKIDRALTRFASPVGSGEPDHDSCVFLSPFRPFDGTRERTTRDPARGS
jgi:hypothetical protein